MTPKTRLDATELNGCESACSKVTVNGKTPTFGLRIKVRQIEDDVRDESTLHETEETSTMIVSILIMAPDEKSGLPGGKERSAVFDPVLGE